MSKSNAFETDLLNLLFNATPIANLADNAASSPLTNLYLSLHTADPGEAGNQSSSECTYTPYARLAVARTSAGFTVSGNSAALAVIANFPQATAGSETASFFGVGTAATGAGVLLYSGAITPAIAIAAGVMPELTTGTAVTED